MDIKEAFAKTLKKYRKDRGISQEALALESGLSRVYVYELEHGLKEPGLLTVFRLCQTLGVEPSEFIKKVKMNLR